MLCMHTFKNHWSHDNQQNVLILKFNWFLLPLWFFIFKIIFPLRNSVHRIVCVVSVRFPAFFHCVWLCVHGHTEIRNPLHYFGVHFYVAVVEHGDGKQQQSEQIIEDDIWKRNGYLSRNWCYFSTLIWLVCCAEAMLMLCIWVTFVHNINSLKMANQWLVQSIECNSIFNLPFFEMCIDAIASRLINIFNNVIILLRYDMFGVFDLI